jgi:hypothetical protein
MISSFVKNIDAKIQIIVISSEESLEASSGSWNLLSGDEPVDLTSQAAVECLEKQGESQRRVLLLSQSGLVP